jgi:5'-phosphate synthase pdxT subunit
VSSPVSAASDGGAAPRVGVLALQGDVREHAAILRSVGAEPVMVRRPADLAAVEALCMPGGESTTISMLLESSGLLEPLRGRLAAGMPVLGTCAGMILLARTIVDGRDDQVSLGAIDLVVRRNAFGRQLESFEADLEVKGIGGPMHAVFIRAPIVEEVGPEVEVLASVRAPATQSAASSAVGAPGAQAAATLVGAPNRPVVCRQGNVIVAAFHPELAGDGRLHELLLGLIASPQHA